MHLLLSALKGLVLGEGTPTEDPVQAIKDVYAQGGSKDADEFLKPIIVGGDERRIKGEFTFRGLASSADDGLDARLTNRSDDDTVFFFNYRSGMPPRRAPPCEERYCSN